MPLLLMTTCAEACFDLNDQSGKETKLTLWYVPGNDAYGLLTRSKRMVESADKLMDGTALYAISTAS
jgi:hypothetical protein